ncbi:MAG: pirin family protein, partial [Verrucomicrobiota bacterium]
RHQSMEIVAYVLKGTLEHEDSLGNRQVLGAGDFQSLSACEGITHSECNLAFRNFLPATLCRGKDSSSSLRAMDTLDRFLSVRTLKFI